MLEDSNATTAPTPKLTRAYFRKAKADAWAAYKIPVELIEVQKLVSTNPNKKKRRHVEYKAVTEAKPVPALYEKDAEGHITRLPLRAERRNMWREAMRA